jgi:hypothetical protein
MQAYYTNDVDFYSLFDADTFDKEVIDAAGDFKGYVFDDSNELVLAATFENDNKHANKTCGMGWYDEELV